MKNAPKQQRNKLVPRQCFEAWPKAVGVDYCKVGILQKWPASLQRDLSKMGHYCFYTSKGFVSCQHLGTGSRAVDIPTDREKARWDGKGPQVLSVGRSQERVLHVKINIELE